MSILSNRIYYINSEKRIAGTPSNFSYALDIPDGEKFDTCCVLAMTVPQSYYLIRAGLNELIVEINGTRHTISIPPGNYSAKNFPTELTSKMQQIGLSVVITFNQTMGKYDYLINEPVGSVKFIFEDPSRLGHQMGFDEVSTNEFVDGILTSKNVLNFEATNTLFLHSDMVQDSTSVLQELYSANAIAFSNLIYNCRFPAMYSKKLRSRTNGVFNFSLVDEHDKELDLNGHHILITLLLYRKENLPQLFRALLLK
jgi:hypothetical protein